MFIVTLEDAFLKSKLLPDASIIQFFINKQQIFLNGVVCNNLKTIISLGDIAQLATSN